MSKKTKKLKCVVTGRILVATLDYYNKKLEAAGDETNLHRSYICKEAKRLLLKGYDVDTCREMLNIDSTDLDSVDNDVITNLTTTGNKYMRTNQTYATNFSMINARTDPILHDLLNNLRNDSK